ncbi:alkaline phosphatase [Wenyingzhuangia sp. IMCC45467]
MHKLIVCVFICSVTAVYAQSSQIHSHNNYSQKVPFWNAFSVGVNSIEADVFLKKGRLYVTHSENEIQKDKTLETLYLKPIMEVLEKKIEFKNLQLVIDVKSDAVKTIKKIENILKKYPKIINHSNIKIVISGNRPKPETYFKYPSYINFDYQEINTSLSLKNLAKVAMVSTSFKDYSVWNGKGRLTHDDFDKVMAVIKRLKTFNKPIRFWATPDSKTAWKTFVGLGVDIINTDQPQKCTEYINTLEHRTAKSIIKSEVYHPTFDHEIKQLKKVKNIILMIGDGNGLSQISSATLANNKELTLTQIKNIGFIKTQSTDDFTTDSAAGGTAFATGKKSYNRAIGVDTNGSKIPNITEVLHAYNFATGCITTDEITGATPSTFYAHQKDRGLEQEIAKDLLTSKLDFFAGGGYNKFKDLEIDKVFKVITKTSQLQNTSKNSRVGVFFSKKGVPSIVEGRGNLLAETTKDALAFLNKKEQPFFIMIEGAQIDTFGHFNDTEGIINEGIDFDRAITEAIKFADTDGETLVIITADHETSGFSVSSGNVEEHQIEGGFITHDHTATMVPVFSYGPQSDKFRGVYENNEIFHKILEVLQIEKK